jgi:hypothetical protein
MLGLAFLWVLVLQFLLVLVSPFDQELPFLLGLALLEPQLA